jgi:hypothetical protein
MPVGNANVFLPVVVMFFVTAFTALRLGYLRMQATARGEMNLDYYRLFRGGDEPDYIRATARHYQNLLEAPLLFYLACVILYLSGPIGTLELAVAWAYVGLRLAHSWVHLARNDVPTRFRLFAASWLVLIVLWGIIAWRLVTAAPV